MRVLALGMKEEFSPEPKARASARGERDGAPRGLRRLRGFRPGPGARSGHSPLLENSAKLNIFIYLYIFFEIENVVEVLSSERCKRL